MMTKLKDVNGNISKDLYVALGTQINNRRTELSGILQYLHGGGGQRDENNSDHFPTANKYTVLRFASDDYMVCLHADDELLEK